MSFLGGKAEHKITLSSSSQINESLSGKKKDQRRRVFWLLFGGPKSDKDKL